MIYDVKVLLLDLFKLYTFNFIDIDILIVKSVYLLLLYRHFKLMLHKSQSVLADDFRVVAIGDDNVERVVDIKPVMYHGYLEGARSSDLFSITYKLLNCIH